MSKKRTFGMFSILFVVLVLVLTTTLASLAVITSASAEQNATTAQTGGNMASGGTKVSIVQGASTLTEKAFSPNPVSIKVGDTVTWTNDDSTFHTVTSGTGFSDTSKGKEFDSGLSTLMTPGKTFSHKFTRAGEFPYFCEPHPTMVGKVIVS